MSSVVQILHFRSFNGISSHRQVSTGNLWLPVLYLITLEQLNFETLIKYFSKMTLSLNKRYCFPFEKTLAFSFHS